MELECISFRNNFQAWLPGRGWWQHGVFWRHFGVSRLLQAPSSTTSIRCPRVRKPHPPIWRRTHLCRRRTSDKHRFNRRFSAPPAGPTAGDSKQATASATFESTFFSHPTPTIFPRPPTICQCWHSPLCNLCFKSRRWLPASDKGRARNRDKPVGTRCPHPTHVR